MTHRILTLLLPLLSVQLAVRADVFNDIRAEIISNNLAVKAEAKRGEAQVEGLFGENTLEAPEVGLSRLWNTVPGGIDKLAISVSQSFDWPGVYAARREAARTSRIASQYALESTLLDLRQEVGAALIDIIHNAQLIEMQTQLVDSVNLMEAYYKKAADLGAETRLDYNKTVIERIAVHRELHSLEAQRDALISTLRSLNGGKDVSEMVSRLGKQYPIMPADTEMTAELLRQRDPGYAAAVAQMEAAKSMAKVERRSRIPGFSIGYEHEKEGEESFNGFSFGLTLPVWGRKHQIRSNMLEAEAAMIDAEMELSQRLAEMEGDRRQLKALRTILDEYEPVVNNMANYELLRKALTAGQINFLTYIEEINYFIAAHREYLDTLYEYNLLLHRLTKYN